MPNFYGGIPARIRSPGHLGRPIPASTATALALGAIGIVYLKPWRSPVRALPFLSWLGRMLALLASIVIGKFELGDTSQKLAG